MTMLVGRECTPAHELQTIAKSRRSSSRAGACHILSAAETGYAVVTSALGKRGKHPGRAGLESGSGEDLEAQLRLLRDKAAIADLVYRYAQHVRAGQGQACRSLFADDAVFEMFVLNAAMEPELQKRLEGIDAVIDYVSAASNPDTRVVPVIHNLIVEVAVDTAESTSAMSATVIPNGARLIGEYRDTYRRVRQEWRFASRAHTIMLHQS